MVIITDAYGNIQSPTIPENVYQGSNLANEIVFLSPLPQNNQCAIIFRLPTGAVTSQYFMTKYTSVPSQYGLNGWMFRVPRAITAYYGQVTFQIKMFGSTYQQGDEETETTEVIMSCQGSFPVLRGVAPPPSEIPSENTFNEIMAYLHDLADGSIVSKGLLPYDSTFTYGIGVSVYDDDTKTIYTSLQDDNVGNDLDVTEYWSAYYVSNLTQTDVQNLIDLKASTLQPLITNSNKLSADLVDDTNTTNKFVTSADKTNWNGKQNALTETQLNAVNSGIDSTKVGQIATNTSNILTIEGKIPSQASSSNQLADKNFVNSSIATNTANFIGTFANIKSMTTNVLLVSGCTLASGSIINAGSVVNNTTYASDTTLDAVLNITTNSTLTAESMIKSGSGISAGSIINHIYYATTSGISVDTTIEADFTLTNNDYAFVMNQELEFANAIIMNSYDKTLLTNYDYAWVTNGTKYDLYRFDIMSQTWSKRATAINKADVSLIVAYNRYKYSGATSEWGWEYTLNNSGFTAVQWQAINSGATDVLIGQITTNQNAISGIKNGTTINDFAGVENALSGKQSTLTFDNTPTENSTNPVTSGGIYTYVNNIVGDIDTILQGLNNGGGV